MCSVLALPLAEPTDTTVPDKRAKLKDLFQKFDFDASGTLEVAELKLIGQTRRDLGQKCDTGRTRGSWTVEQNRRLMELIDTDGGGKVSCCEFVEHYMKVLPDPTDEFNTVVQDFQDVADVIIGANSITSNRAKQAEAAEAETAKEERKARLSETAKARAEAARARAAGAKAAEAVRLAEQEASVLEPSREDMEYLRSNLSLTDQFEAMYGRGMAQRCLDLLTAEDAGNATPSTPARSSVAATPGTADSSFSPMAPLLLTPETPAVPASPASKQKVTKAGQHAPTASMLDICYQSHTRHTTLCTYAAH